MLDKINRRYGSHVRHENHLQDYLARGAVFGRDTVMVGRIHMELNFTELYWIISESDTVAGIPENDSFTAMNLLSCSINVL
jgi:hypothetical protein